MRLKEVKISIHRKYTKDFQSYGYRIGVMLDVDKVDNARTCYYSAKVFLNDRIAEEDLIIKNLMDKRDAEKSSGYKELSFVPEGNLIVKNIVDKGVAGKKLGKSEKKLEKIDLSDRNIKRIVGETGMKRDDVVNLVNKKSDDLKGLVSFDGAVYMVGKELGVDVVQKEGVSVAGSGKKGDVDMIPFDVRQIKSTSHKAVLVELFGNKGDWWIPKSCVGDGDAMDLMQKGVKTQLFVASWFLKKSGLML